jgi:MoxR-like ATPase
VGVSLQELYQSIEDVEKGLKAHNYFASRSLATIIYLGLKVGKPLFVEGEPGVGKTEIAKVLAKMTNGRLVRLQCYEGIDANMALYEWNYQKQIIRIKMTEGKDNVPALEDEIFSEKYLIKRPLMEAISGTKPEPVILLIDEIDRADEEFEAFLLEVLSDFQVTVPELGTFTAQSKPAVIITSNQTREVHPALKRRCFYHWLDYPSLAREMEIITAKTPSIKKELAGQISSFMKKIRELQLIKNPGVAESLDWAAALLALNAESLDEDLIKETLGCICKYRQDQQRVTMEVMGGKVEVGQMLKEWQQVHG